MAIVLVREVLQPELLIKDVTVTTGRGAHVQAHLRACPSPCGCQVCGARGTPGATLRHESEEGRGLEAAKVGQREGHGRHWSPRVPTALGVRAPLLLPGSCVLSTGCEPTEGKEHDGMRPLAVRLGLPSRRLWRPRPRAQRPHPWAGSAQGPSRPLQPRVCPLRRQPRRGDHLHGVFVQV